MGFVKFIIGLPLVLILLVFAFISLHIYLHIIRKKYTNYQKTNEILSFYCIILNIMLIGG